MGRGGNGAWVLRSSYEGLPDGPYGRTSGKDVVRWREQYRGDVLLKLAIAPALARAIEVKTAGAAPTAAEADAEPSSKLASGAETIAKSERIAAHVAEGRLYELSTLPRYLAISLALLRQEGRDRTHAATRNHGPVGQATGVPRRAAAFGGS